LGESFIAIVSSVELLLVSWFEFRAPRKIWNRSRNFKAGNET